ncbi:MAG: hypothetical protein ACREBJ_00430 [Nitrosotalea sp.]
MLQLKYNLSLAILLASPFLIQYVIAIPYPSPGELYKQSDIVLYGKVIVKVGSGSDYYYQIKAEQYFKNPQTSDSITVSGHVIDNKTHMSYPQFEVGDKAIFYIVNQATALVISPYSTKAGDACDIHAFLGTTPIPGEPIARGKPSPINLLDENGLRIGTSITNHPVSLKYNLVNNYPSSRNFTIEASIQNQNDASATFYKKQVIELGACESTGDALKWSFVPSKSGNYNVNVNENGEFISKADFQVENSNSSKKLNSVLPLQQFNSGVPANNVTCKEGLQLILKSENNHPACVKPDTVNILIERGWAKQIS